MKRECRLLLDKACDSMILAVEHFNRPQEIGRVSTVLILLDHAFEMLLKAAILHNGGKIRERRAKQTIGFDACVRRGLSDGSVKFLSDDQALTLQSINGLRDAAQHHLLDISEGQLYVEAQAGLTLFRDLLSSVFGLYFADRLPARVLPLATQAPTDIETLFATEVDEIKKLLRPGKRRQTEANARLRPLAILESTIRGEKGQPSPGDLNKLKDQVLKGKDWTQIFPGVASVQLQSESSGPGLSMRLMKKEGVPVQLVPEGTPGASVVAIKRVNELDFYNLGRDQLAKKVGLSGPKTTAVVRHLKLQDDQEYFKEIAIGSSRHQRYSKNAIDRIKEELDNGLDLDAVWRAHGPRRK